MQRITITLEDEFLDEIDRVAEQRGYTSRSEAIRDLVRAGLLSEEPVAGDTPCVAALTYVYDHETRELARRLTDEQHEHHDLTVATLHVHLDHHQCLEVSVLKGRRDEVAALANRITSQRGVTFGRLHTISASDDAV